MRYRTRWKKKKNSVLLNLSELFACHTLVIRESNNRIFLSKIFMSIKIDKEEI